MGIFEKLINKVERNPKSTRGFYFGASEAEGENIDGQSLTDYFEDYLDILSELKNGKFIFVGRKGVGKSAIAKFIKDSSQNTESSFAKLIRVNDFDLEKNIQIDFDPGSQKEKLIFEWLILVNIVKLIISNKHSQYTKEYDKLQKFLDINSGVVNIDVFEVIESSRNKGGEVSFGNLLHVFGGVFKNYFDVKTTRAEFYKLIPPLRDIVKIILEYPVNKEIEFWILFDDLDVNFNIKSEQDNFKLMELIRISKFYNNEIFNHNNSRILIFLRDDIKNKLAPKYEDSAKIFNTYQIPLFWYDHRLYSGNSEDLIPLKKLANKRIELNFKKNGISYGSDPWQTLFEDENYNGTDFPKKTSFKYILDFTFYRPRDLITFLNTMTSESCEFPLNKRDVKSLLPKYIELNINEIKSELKLFFNDEELRKIFDKLFPYIISSANCKSENVLEFIDSLNLSMGHHTAFEILTNYSLLIYRDAFGTLYFNYREEMSFANINKSELFITLPKCVYHYYKKIT
jgi:hypothetical protein